jgi:hypothetical protein
MSLIRENAENNDLCDYIPFSGHFMSRTENGDMRKSFAKSSNMYPTEEKAFLLKSLLSEKKLTPDDVLMGYSRHNQRTVFCDLVGKGHGLASFINIWLSAAQHDLTEEYCAALSQAAIFHIFKFRNAPQIFNVESHMGTMIAIPLQATTGDSMDFVYDVAGGQGETDYDPGSDRLVPSFDISSKGSGVFRNPENKARIDGIKTQMRLYHTGARRL